MTHDQIVAHAMRLFDSDPSYRDDALRFARMGNSIVGSIVNLTLGVPRQYAEPAVLDAARQWRRRRTKRPSTE